MTQNKSDLSWLCNFNEHSDCDTKDCMCECHKKITGHFIEPVTNESLGRVKPHSSGGGDIEFSRLMDWLEIQKAEKEQHGFTIVSIKIVPSPTWLDRWQYELEYIKAPKEDKRKDQSKYRKKMGLPL